MAYMAGKAERGMKKGPGAMRAYFSRSRSSSISFAVLMILVLAE